MKLFWWISATVVLAALLPVYFPNAFWHLLMLVDFFHPFLFNNSWVEQYHSYLISNLSEKPELRTVEIPRELATKEYIYKVSNGYTIPVVIRKALDDVPALNIWTNKSWWLENYGEEEIAVSILCLSQVCSCMYILCVC